MNVVVNRLLQDNDTISTVEVNGVLKYYGIEIAKPIPSGTYKLTKYFSPEHQFYVPLVNNVPGFVGIEIHVANTVSSVKGCLGIADNIASLQDITNSTAAVNEFYPLLFADLDKWIDCFITYIDLY